MATLPRRSNVSSRSRLQGYAIAAAVAVGLLACGGDGGPPAPSDGGSCPRDLPAACPPTPPSWSATVQAIVQTRCTGCHSRFGVESNRPLDGYARVYAQRGPALNQIYACRMPPADAPALTPDERAALLAWFVCGAPEN
jgi:hypothetical protein